jgi:cell division protein FtsQ
MSELKPDTSLLAVHLDELKQRIEKHPWIRSVNLEKRFPHTLVIKAEKEKPCAIVIMGNMHYMNRWGKIFRRVDMTAHMDFPLVTGQISLYFLSLPAVIELEGPQLGEKMEDLKRLVKHLKRTGRIQMVKRINLNYREGAVVSYKNDGVVS